MTTVQNLACSCVPWCQPREQRKMHERQSSPTNLHGRLEVIMRLSDLVFGWKRPTSALQAPRPPSISFRRGLSPNRWLSTSDAGRALSRVPLPGSAACATPTSRPASLTSVRRAPWCRLGRCSFVGRRGCRSFNGVIPCWRWLLAAQTAETATR